VSQAFYSQDVTLEQVPGQHHDGSYRSSIKRRREKGRLNIKKSTEGGRIQFKGSGRQLLLLITRCEQDPENTLN